MSRANANTFGNYTEEMPYDVANYDVIIAEGYGPVHVFK